MNACARELQSKYLDVKKNRFDGQLGRIPFFYDQDTERFVERATPDMPLPTPRLDDRRALARGDAGDAQRKRASAFATPSAGAAADTAASVGGAATASEGGSGDADAGTPSSMKPVVTPDVSLYAAIQARRQGVTLEGGSADDEVATSDGDDMEEDVGAHDDDADEADDGIHAAGVDGPTDTSSWDAVPTSTVVHGVRRRRNGDDLSLMGMGDAAAPRLRSPRPSPTTGTASTRVVPPATVTTGASHARRHTHGDLSLLSHGVEAALRRGAPADSAAVPQAASPAVTAPATPTRRVGRPSSQDEAEALQAPREPLFQPSPTTSWPEEDIITR